MDVAGFILVEQAPRLEPTGWQAVCDSALRTWESGHCDRAKGARPVLPTVLNGYTVLLARDFLRRFTANLEPDNLEIQQSLGALFEQTNIRADQRKPN